jgi:hypothetical protein
MKFFEFSNTSGEIFRAKFTTKQEKLKAYKRMWNYYNNDNRLHPILEFLDLAEEQELKLYTKAEQGNVWAIQRCLRIMWSRTDLSSFYGKIVTIR